MVYVSYNQDDASHVLYLSQKLKQRDINVWIDVEKLLAGDLLSDKIEEGLKKSSTILFCVGKKGLSKWQEQELAIAKEIQERDTAYKILFVCLPGGEPITFSEFKQISFFDTFENKVEFEKLLLFLGNKGAIYAKEIDSSHAINVQKPLTQNKLAVSVALVFNNEVLMLKRALTQKSGSGLWQLPGGKVKDKEDALSAAIREVEEEVGIFLTGNDLCLITDLVDTWIADATSGYITMRIYISYVKNKQTVISHEFSDNKWINFADLFIDESLLFFGSTQRYLRVIRRYTFTHLPMKELSQIILNSENNEKIPTKLSNISTETSQVLLAFLSLLGFLDDKEYYKPSSTLSGRLIRMLSEWALTESVIFEAAGDRKWQDEVEKKGNIQEVEKFKKGLFDQHKSFLGLLSHKLPKVMSTRHVCDILLVAYNPKDSKNYLLIRWDFLAEKFQIPAKGLEELNTDISSIEAPKYVIKERFNKDLMKMFDYQLYNKIKTSHVGAGSLGDGPLVRNFIVAIYKIIPKSNYLENIVSSLNQINRKTIKELETDKETMGDDLKRILNFYLWVDIDYLDDKRNSLLGMKLQGYEEIVSEFGSGFMKSKSSSILLSPRCKIPIITKNTTLNGSQLDIIF